MRLITCAVFAYLAGLVPAVGAADVDDARLLNAASDRANWLTYGRDYGNQRFSPLKSIDATNVKKLAPRWIYQGGAASTFQASPIVAVAYGKVFMGTVDARLVALDAKTGKLVWDAPLVDDVEGTTEQAEQLASNDPLRRNNVTGSTGVGANMAPVVYRGKVIIGLTGVGYGLHLDSDRPGAPIGAVIGIAGQSQRAGFYAAFDAGSGKKIWQFDSTIENWEGEFRTVTPDGVQLDRDVAHEKATLAQHRDSWKRGGGSAWTTPAVDPALGLLYLGVGNPSPQMDDVTRPGDNLYTVSLVAVDIETGKRKWHYQQVPHDMWGYDVASPPVLFDFTDGGRKIPAVEPVPGPTWGVLSAIDLRNGGKIKWQAKTPQPLIGGVLATAGGVVFTGEGNGNLSAFDSRNGELLWQFNCGAGVNAPPVAFEVDGTQYIAVAAGGSALWGYRQGEAVIAFALPR